MSLVQASYWTHGPWKDSWNVEYRQGKNGARCRDSGEGRIKVASRWPVKVYAVVPVGRTWIQKTKKKKPGPEIGFGVFRCRSFTSSHSKRPLTSFIQYIFMGWRTGRLPRKTPRRYTKEPPKDRVDRSVYPLGNNWIEERYGVRTRRTSSDPYWTSTWSVRREVLYIDLHSKWNLVYCLPNPKGERNVPFQWPYGS